MKKIFLIDDDADDRLLFCEAMGDVAPDFICHVAVNGRAALRKLDRNEIDIPDLIFLDLNMPLVNGWQCLAEIKKKELYKDIPVIIYSTSSYPEDIDQAVQSGALCYFSKPYDFKELKKSLRIVAEHLIDGTLHHLTDHEAFVGMMHG
jgi:CheY-like chemotaxis protein